MVFSINMHCNVQYNEEDSKATFGRPNCQDPKMVKLTSMYETELAIVKYSAYHFLDGGFQFFLRLAGFIFLWILCLKNNKGTMLLLYI